MTADEHLEQLLNRAGQTISDLPKGNRKEGAYPGQKVRAMQAVCQFDRMLDVSDVGILNCLDYILHLTDVIDRMEWALENVIGERDYLEKRLADVDCDCDICVYADVNEAEMPCYQCDIPPAEKHFEFAGIPEDWRADNGTESDA